MGHKDDGYTNNCVCDILLDIVEEQEKVSPTSGCLSSCDVSLRELRGKGLSPTKYTTIPVSLICSSTCDYFIGMGVRRSLATGAAPTAREQFESVVFNVVDVDPETCCATLELLQPHDVSVPSPDPNLTKAQYLLGLLDDETSYRHTGICITVNLDCFCGVVCHPPVTPQPIS